ncbi:MAG: SDR family oxidoreductase [Firmicutes bacterium]|nr:SDR family oxidoreductase [Bacillota bacterium]
MFIVSAFAAAHHTDLALDCSAVFPCSLNHLAGVTKTIEEIDEDEWDRMMNVNLRAAFFLTKAVYRKMKEQRSGRIIALTSIAGQRGGFFSGAHYCASKGGLESMMKCFALNGAPYGILCNCISPGVVETPMTKEEGVTADGIPLGRAAQPEELAEVIAFLVHNTYINGATIDVNGGQLMR